MKNHYKKFIFLIVVLCLSFLFMACENGGSLGAEAEGYWPTSSPEAQGMDSEALLEMMEFASKRGMDIHSLLIIRNGHMVLESNFHPYRSDVPHMLHSITKNVTATLIGIAIEEGYIESVDQKMVELLPALDLEHLDERIKDITVEDLLTMQTGLYWGSGNTSSVEMYFESEDQLMYALEREMVTDPGDVHEYNSGSTHILSAIITEATGKSTMEYAEEKLFTPLNITDVQWVVDKQDYYIGGDMMFMKAVDLAKFGSLYLQKGVWEDEQIISEEWVEISTKNHVDKGNYGYSWFTPDFGGYVGSGAGGQHLLVLPEEDIIVVVTSGIGSGAYGFLNSFIQNWILGAIVQEEAIDENPEAYTQLQSVIEHLDSPEDKIEEITLPETATRISGNTYSLDNGDSYTFDFSPGDEAIWIWEREGIGEFEITIGLDNVFRSNHIENFFFYDQVGTRSKLRGHWEDENTFIIDFKPLENPMSYFYEFQFDGDSLHHTRTNRMDNSVYLTTKGTVSQ